MTPERLSEEYSKATLFIHKLTDELYESLHEAKKGGPVVEWETVIDHIKEYRKGISIELDYIKSALDEYQELRARQRLG